MAQACKGQTGANSCDIVNLLSTDGRLRNEKSYATHVNLGSISGLFLDNNRDVSLLIADRGGRANLNQFLIGNCGYRARSGSAGHEGFLAKPKVRNVEEVSAP